MSRRNRPPVPSRALPSTIVELEAQRVVVTKNNLLEEVEQAYKAMIGDPTFRALRGADNPDATVEGDENDDAVLSAKLLREKGEEMELRLLAVAVTSDLRLKMRAIERRFNAQRDGRRNVA